MQGNKQHTIFSISYKCSKLYSVVFFSHPKLIYLVFEQKSPTPACIRPLSWQLPGKLCCLPLRHSFIRQEFFQLGHESFTLDYFSFLHIFISHEIPMLSVNCFPPPIPLWKLASFSRLAFSQSYWLNYISWHGTGVPACRWYLIPLMMWAIQRDTQIV